MEKVIYDLRLNVKYSGCKQQIELQKGETNARIFRMELCDGTNPIKLNTISQTAVIRAVKADGKLIYDTASIKNGKVEYTLTKQDSAAVGKIWYEVQIIDNGKLDDEKKVLYTAQFKAVVKDTAVDDGKITSSDNFSRLDQIIRDNEEWLEQSKNDIDKRTLVYDSELVLTAASNTTPDKVHSDYYGVDRLTFTSPWFTRDCDFIEIKNESINYICNVTVLDSNGKERQIGQIVTSGTLKVDLNVVNNLTYRIVILGKGPYDADITKFKFYKYKYISAAIDDVNKKHKEDIDQVYAKHNTDFETIRQQVIKRVKFYSTVKKFIEEMLKMPSDTSLYISIHVIRDSVTPILYVRYIDSEYNDFKYVSDESFYENLSIKDTGVKIGYYYIAAASEPRTWNYDVLSKIVSVPYTKNEVRELLNAVNQFNVAIVNKLPEDNIDSHTIYFVPKEDKDTSDDYDEYIYLNNKWEHIGNTVIDLSNYVTQQRKIAELSLEKDITTFELQAKLKESDNYSSDVTQAWLERFDDDIKPSQKFKNAIKEETSGKVDKENGKSLIDDNEIERLKKVNNYDDTNIKKQFNDEIEKLKGTLIENTASGTEMVISDSSNMSIQELHLYGKSEQVVTTGAQLFDVNAKLTWNSVFSVDSEGWISAVIPANTGTKDTYYSFNTKKSDLLKPSTTYLAVMEMGTTLDSNINIVGVSPDSGSGNKPQFQGYVNFTKSSVAKCKAIDSFEKSNVMCKGYIQVKPGFAGGQVKFRFSLIEDTSVTIDTFKYESYTGGEPSPSPDYPQEIESVESPTVTISGKNLYSIFFDGLVEQVTNSGVTYTRNSDGSLSIKGTATGGKSKYTLIDYELSKKIFSKFIGEKYCMKIFGLPSNCYFEIAFSGSSYGEKEKVLLNTLELIEKRYTQINIPEGVTINTTVYPMLVLGDTITEYEPYKPIQSTTINCNFDGIDDIRDELIVKNDGSNKLIQRLVDLQNIQPVVQGLYTKDTKAANTDLVYFYARKAPRTLAKKYGTVKASSNKFRWASSNIWALDEPYVFDVYSVEGSENARVLLRINKDDDIDEIFKEGINIEYALEEPIIDDYLTPEEVQEILELNTYKPTTTIWSDQNVDMEIKYIADPKSYIDNKFNELASAIVASASESE